MPPDCSDVQNTDEVTAGIVESPEAKSPETKSPPTSAKRKKERPENGAKRKLAETPSMIDSGLVAKKLDTELGGGEEPPVAFDEPMEICDNSLINRGSDKQHPEIPPVPKPRTPKSKRKIDSGVSSNGKGTPLLENGETARMDSKPPPADSNKEAQPMKRRSSKKEKGSRNDEDRPIPHERSRPNTPRGKAPSPEPEDIKSKLESQQALVAPLPPPRVQDSPKIVTKKQVQKTTPPPSAHSPVQGQDPGIQRRNSKKKQDHVVVVASNQDPPPVSHPHNNGSIIPNQHHQSHLPTPVQQQHNNNNIGLQSAELQRKQQTVVQQNQNGHHQQPDQSPRQQQEQQQSGQSQVQQSKPSPLSPEQLLEQQRQKEAVFNQARELIATITSPTPPKSAANDPSPPVTWKPPTQPTTATGAAATPTKPNDPEQQQEMVKQRQLLISDNNNKSAQSQNQTTSLQQQQQRQQQQSQHVSEQVNSHPVGLHSNGGNIPQDNSTFQNERESINNCRSSSSSNKEHNISGPLPTLSDSVSEASATALAPPSPALRVSSKQQQGQDLNKKAYYNAALPPHTTTTTTDHYQERNKNHMQNEIEVDKKENKIEHLQQQQQQCSSSSRKPDLKVVIPPPHDDNNGGGTSNNDNNNSNNPLVVPFPKQAETAPMVTDPKPPLDSPRSLINSVPKPFKPDSPPVEKQGQTLSPLAGQAQHHTTAAAASKDKTPDSVASAVSLSSSGSNNSNNHLKLDSCSPGHSGTSLNKPGEKRDSKVIKAAAYWNNYIGEVIQKSKPPDNVKDMDKPKKIVSAGVGPRGMDHLKNTFESKKAPKTSDEKLAIMRRNSKKLNLEGCTPGLRVNDAKSVFETKSQPPATPTILRRNSVNSGQQPKWTKNEEAAAKQSEPDLPFGKQRSTLPKAAEKGNSSKNNTGTLVDVKSSSSTSKDGGRKSPSPRMTKIVVTDAKEAQQQQKQQLLLPPPGSNETKSSTTTSSSNGQGKLPGSSGGSHIPKPPTSPKPKLKKDDAKAKDKSPATVTTTSNKENVCKITKDQESQGLVLSVKTELGDKKPSLTKKETTGAAEEDFKNMGETEKEAKLAAVGVISREVFKSDGNKKQTKKSLASPTPSQPVKKVIVAKASSSTASSPAATLLTSDVNTTAKEGIIVNNNIPNLVSHIQPPSDDLMVESVSTTGPVTKPVTKITYAKSPPSTPATPATPASPSNVSGPTSQTGTSPTTKEESSTPSLASSIATAATITTPAQISKAIEESSPPSKQGSPAATPKIKTIETKTDDPQNKLEIIKSSLKKVPHAPAMGRRPSTEISDPVELVLEDKKKNGSTKSVQDTLVNHEASKMEIPKTVEDLKQRPVTGAEQQKTKVANPDHKGVEIVKKSESKVTTEGDRIIPIKFEPSPGNNNKSLPPIGDQSKSKASGSMQGHKLKTNYIPINVEGRGTILRTPDPTEDQDEASEKLDQFQSNSLSRRRWGSRKKRMSSAYSDSSMSDDDSTFNAPFGGLQKYNSLGKNGLDEQTSMHSLKRTKPPFALNRTESFSSEEGDDFDDDGFREMTAENLFSTLLTRVKSLTKRIHDEHAEHLNWQQSQRIINHALNPGSTHARLERAALRNSIKRSGASTPTSFSRQSSMIDDGISSLRSYDGAGPSPSNLQHHHLLQQDRAPSSSNMQAPTGRTTPTFFSRGTAPSSTTTTTTSPPPPSVSSVNSTSREPYYAPPPPHLPPSSSSAADSMLLSDVLAGIENGLKGLAASQGASSSLDRAGSRYRLDQNQQKSRPHPPPHSYPDDDQDLLASSVTSSQRLRPGYLPPPHLLSSQSSKTYNNSSRQPERHIPIQIESGPVSGVTSPVPTSSQPGTPVSFGVYMKPMKPFSSPHAGPPEALADIESQKKQRRVSRFLRPDFYDDAGSTLSHHNNPSPPSKDDSIYKQQLGQQQQQQQSPTRASVIDRQNLQRQSSVVSPPPPKISQGQSSSAIKSGSVTPQAQSSYPEPATAQIPDPIPGRSKPGPSEGQFLTRALTLRRQNSLKEPSSNSPSSPNASPQAPPPHLTSSVTISRPRTSFQPSSFKPRPIPPFSQSQAVKTNVSASKPSSSSIPKIAPLPSITSTTTTTAPKPINALPSAASARTTSTTSQYSSSMPRPTTLMQPPPRPPSTPPFRNAVVNTAGSTGTSATTSPEPPVVVVGDTRFSGGALKKNQNNTLTATEKEEGGGGGIVSSEGGKRRPILPYGGAKSDGLLNKHAFITCNIIAAAERKKRELPSAPGGAAAPIYSRSSTSELLPLEKVIAQLKLLF